MLCIYRYFKHRPDFNSLAPLAFRSRIATGWKTLVLSTLNSDNIAWYYTAEWSNDQNNEHWLLDSSHIVPSSPWLWFFPTWNHRSLNFCGPGHLSCFEPNFLINSLHPCWFHFWLLSHALHLHLWNIHYICSKEKPLSLERSTSPLFASQS